MDSMQGKWDGLMHDVEGFDARATLELTDQGGRLAGRFSYQVVAKHELAKPVEGAIEGKRGKTGLVELSGKLEGFGVVRFEGRAVDVQHHARAALVGTYTVASQQQKEIGQGTAIFWLFADKR